MAKNEEKPVTPIKARPPHYTDVTGCVICGLYEGELSESVGVAKWHKACGEARPDCVAKVKLRAMRV